MAMYGTFQRVTPAELADAVVEPARALAAFDRNATGAAAGRLYHLDQAWHGVQFLLDNAGVDLDAVFYANVFDLGDDGPMGAYLRPGEVAAAAEVLAEMPPGELATYFDADTLAGADISPGGWRTGSDQARAWLISHYDGLTEYLRAAAKDGDAVLFWVVPV